MQGAFAYCFKQNDIMQTTYDDVQDDAGRDLLAKIRLRRRTGPRTSRLLFDILLMDVVRLQACPNEIFIVQAVKAYTGRQQPRHPMTHVLLLNCCSLTSNPWQAFAKFVALRHRFE